MGKKVVIPEHPSNTFFAQFANTHMYSEPSQMVATLQAALAAEPSPMVRTQGLTHPGLALRSDWSSVLGL